MNELINTWGVVNAFYSHGSFEWQAFRVNTQSLIGHFIIKKKINCAALVL